MQQAGARHCADVNGTFSGEEWVYEREPVEPIKLTDEYPLWLRATMDPETALRLLEIWKQ